MQRINPQRLFSSSKLANRRGRRVLFNIPGSEERKLNKIQTLDIDVAVLDLEDGVSLNRKDEARKLVYQYLKDDKFPIHTERSIRMNHIGSGLEDEDLRECVIPSLPYLDSLLIPKVETDEQIISTAWRLSDAYKNTNKDHPLEIIAAIESAKGMINLKEICSAKLPSQIKLTGLVVCMIIMKENLNLLMFVQ